MKIPKNRNPAQAHRSRRAIDYAGLSLAVVGLIASACAYILITYGDANALIIVPGVVTLTIGSTNLTKQTADRTALQTHPSRGRKDHIADVLARSRSEHDPDSGQPWETTSAASIDQHLTNCAACTPPAPRGKR